MKPLLQLISLIGLALTVVPAFLVFGGVVTWRTHAMLMLIGTLVWFAATPFWMRSDASEA